MSEKKELAAQGFYDGARYDAARPSYPDEAIEYFVATFALDNRSRVLDLGAGTGIFSRQLIPHVGRLIAVDPSASMREAFRAATPKVEVLDGSDVNIPLETASADAVFVAQAFHWFDAPLALSEIHRVLRPGGGLGLIWNERDESVNWVHELTRAMQWDTRAPYLVGTDHSLVIAQGPFVDVRRVKFQTSQTLTHQGLTQRVLTTSYIAAMSDEERRRTMDVVATVIEQLPDPVELPYVTDVYSARASTP
jgi:SAM-dependent methyltransferase